MNREELNRVIKNIKFYAPYTSNLPKDDVEYGLWVEEFGAYEVGLVNRAVKEICADKETINKFYQAPIQAIKEQIEIIQEKARIEKSRIEGKLESWVDPYYLRFLAAPKGMDGTTHYRMMSDYEIMYWVTFKLTKKEYERDYHQYVFDRDEWHPISDWNIDKAIKASKKREEILKGLKK